MSTAARLLPWVAVLVLGAGCQFRLGGSTSPENEADRLRKADVELRAEIGRLQKRLAASEMENEILRRKAAGTEGPVATAVVATSIELDGFSGLYDTDRDAKADTARLYVRTLDAEGRMLPVTGRALVQLLQGDKIVATREFDPKAFAAAYRSNFTGTHFTLEVPVPAGSDALLARVVVEDLVTGQRLRAEKALSARK